MSTGNARQSAPSDGNYAERIDKVDLPEPVLEVVEEYEAVGGERDRFVWKWIYRLFPSFTLSTVPQRHREEVRTGKTLFTVFITLLDDIAEKNGDAGTFDRIHRAVRWPDAGVDDRADAGVDDRADGEVVEFAQRLWTRIQDHLAAAPRYDEFRDVFQYDLEQALNAMEYSRILNERPAMANVSGARHYDSHNMVLFPYTDVDLMYSPAFEMTDFGVLRELIWDLQLMARIGNWVSTWERELAEGDYTAGIVVYALQNGLVTREELAAASEGEPAAIERIKTHCIEELFLAEWEQLHETVKERALEARSVDLDAFVDGMETVMEHHMASKGHK